MTHDQDPDRRRFLRTALTAAGTLACPWGMQTAFATVTGRAVITFQVPPDGIHFFTELLGAIRERYQPDLGTKPVAIPGASGGTAVETVVRSPRDGATVLIAPSTMLSLAPIVWTTPNDPADTLIPVAGIGAIALGFVVGPAVPAQVRTMSDYLKWVLANPRSNSYGVPGLGTATNYIGAEIGRLADVPLRVVGYKGVVGLIQDIATGGIPAGVAPVTGPADMEAFPQMRVLGVTGEQRLSYLPAVPTLRESGLAEYTPEESLGMFLPTGTPDQKVQELAAAVRAAMQSPAVMEAMVAVGMSSMADSGDSYAKTLSKERAMWKTFAARHDFTGGR